MLYSFVFYTTDASFDYNSPFGTKTYNDIDEHGFDIEIDENNKIDISSLNGFGYCSDMKKIKTYKGLLYYITERYDYIEGDKKQFDKLIKLLEEHIC